MVKGLEKYINLVIWVLLLLRQDLWELNWLRFSRYTVQKDLRLFLILISINSSTFYRNYDISISLTDFTINCIERSIEPRSTDANVHRKFHGLFQFRPRYFKVVDHARGVPSTQTHGLYLYLAVNGHPWQPTDFILEDNKSRAFGRIQAG